MRHSAQLSQSSGIERVRSGVQGSVERMRSLLILMAFQVHTRAATTPHYMWTAQQLEATALRLMCAQYPLELRLLGVRCAPPELQRSIPKVQQGHRPVNA